MKQLILLISMLGLAACQVEQDISDRTPSELRIERKKCEAQGGRFLPGALSGLVCFLETEDAGKSCSSYFDCQGQCMAETRTCSAVTPMFGCFSMLDEDGKVTEICID